jgi:hypothetical protein
MAKVADRLVEVDEEIGVLEEALVKLRQETSVRRELTEVVRQLRTLRQERYVLQATQEAHRKRNSVRRLRALAKVQFDTGNATAGWKLEAQANAHEIELEKAKAEKLREEMAEVSTDDMVAAVVQAVGDEAEVDTDAARQIYLALLDRDDADDFVGRGNVVRLRP